MDDLPDPLFDLEPTPPFLEKNRSRLQLVFLVLLRFLLRFILPVVIVAGVVFLLIDLAGEKTGCLLVMVEPDSAVVILNGSAILQRTGELVENLSPGSIMVSVYRQWFTPVPEEFFGEIAAGETLRVHFTLTPEAREPDFEPVNFGVNSQPKIVTSVSDNSLSSGRPKESLRSNTIYGSIIVSSNVQGAEIWLNAENSGLATNASLDSLDAGRYVIAVKRDGFKTEPDSQAVVLEWDYQIEIVYFDLKPIYELVNPSLTVRTVPVSAEISLDGEFMGESEITLDLNLGSYTLSFGSVKNFHTPGDIVVELTRRNPVQTVTIEYNRVLGNSAIAVINILKEGLIEGDKFSFYLDGLEYFNPDHRKLRGYLFDNLPPGRHMISFVYEGAKSVREVELENGYVTNIDFIIERVFNRKNIKLKSVESIPRSEWMRAHAQMNIQSVPWVE